MARHQDKQEEGDDSPVVVKNLFAKKKADGSGYREDSAKDLAGIDELLFYFKDVSKELFIVSTY